MRVGMVCSRSSCFLVTDSEDGRLFDLLEEQASELRYHPIQHKFYHTSSNFTRVPISTGSCLANTVSAPVAGRMLPVAPRLYCCPKDIYDFKYIISRVRVHY